MSLSDLTRNSFESGISAAKWVALCKLYISKNSRNILPGLEDVQSVLSSSVLTLYRSYPGDPVLRDYLKQAIQDGILSLSVYVATFLQAARSPELHFPETLELLSRVAFDAYNSSGLPPVGSVVSYTESPIVVLDTVQDALALLRTAYSLQIPHSHQLINYASELVILLLSCVNDMSQISTAQALVSFADVSDILHTLQLVPAVRQVLETYVMSLSLLIGDDAKAAREAQMMHTIQLAFGKGDILGPNLDSDIITFSLTLHQLVFDRANEFGSGSGQDPVAILVGIIRWSAWTPLVFYRQLFLSAFTCLSQCNSDANANLLWKSFIIGRLPQLLVEFEKVMQGDGANEAEWRAAMQMALTSLLEHTALLAQCDRIPITNSQDTMDVDFETPRPFARDFIYQLMLTGLLDQTSAFSLAPTLSNDVAQRLYTEAQDHGMGLESYFDFKLTVETSLEDSQSLLRRVHQDLGCHAEFAKVMHKRFTSVATSLEIEPLSHLCKILYQDGHGLDIVSLYVKVSDFVCHALSFLEEYDCETVGDPQTAVSLVGEIVMFLQWTIVRFRLPHTFRYGDMILSTMFLRSTDDTHPLDANQGEDRAAIAAWSKALFDISSEGIEDTIIRSTKPKTLLRISARLFCQAITAYSEKRIDADVFNNGVSYFLGSLLSWTLVGVIKALLKEVQLKGCSSTPIHLEALQTLLSSSCPQPILSLCSPSLLRFFATLKGQNLPKFDAIGIQKRALKSLGLNNAANSLDSLSMGSQTVWVDQGRQIVRDALSFARLGRAPALNVDRCLLFTPPTKFLQLLWSELASAANSGDLEICKRISTFVLTMPRSPSTPPLLPIFLHAVLPSLLPSVDHQPLSDQTSSVELLVATISSVLTAALHLEWSLRSVCGEPRYVLGQSSTGMARKLAGSLRAQNESPTSGVIARRLASSPSFVANFPVFIADM